MSLLLSFFFAISFKKGEKGMKFDDDVASHHMQTKEIYAFIDSWNQA